MTEQNIEQLFKDALSNLEADVNPNVWTNIEQGLQTPVSSNHVSGNSSAVKTANIMSKLSLKSLIFISGASLTIVGTAIYFYIKTPEIKTESSFSINPISNETTAPVTNQPHVISGNINPATGEVQKEIPAPKALLTVSKNNQLPSKEIKINSSQSDLTKENSRVSNSSTEKTVPSDKPANQK